MTPTSPTSNTCDGGYWEQVECGLRQPSWLADTGIPLLATLIGLGIAVWLVRRQIAHDRELRRADRRARAVNSFGIEAVEILGSFWNTTDDAWWREKRWPRWGDLYDAHMRVSAALGEPAPFSELVLMVRDLSWIWRACARRRATLDASGLDFTDDDNRLAMDCVFNAPVNRCYEVAEFLIAWDGRGRVPDAPRSGPLVHVPLPVRTRREAHRRWMRYFEDDYESHLRRISTGRKRRAAAAQGASSPSL